ncbi:MAG: COX15/CtaA family protein [Actinomycetia bacterium]|nr:COX15/CtaA family protein [Actinomycetes bacterium]
MTTVGGSWRAVLGWVTVGLVWLLVALGAIVNASGSGAGCGTAWPTCLGAWTPPPRLAADLEWAHRMGALVVTAFLAAGAGAVWRTGDAAGRRLAGVVGGVWVAQVGLGALTVATGLPPVVVAAHDLGALALLVAALAIAFYLRPHRVARPAESPRAWLWTTAGALAAAVLLGSYTAHLGQACDGLATCATVLGWSGGGAQPGLAHGLAVGVAFGAAVQAWRKSPRSPAGWRRWLGAASAMLALEALVGGTVLATALAPVLLGVHEVLGVTTAALAAAAALAATWRPAAE